MSGTETRERILLCATDLYIEGGLSGFSMRKVAKCAGLSATAIYRHFQDKESLIAAICEEGFRCFAACTWPALGEATPLERFRKAGEGYLRFALEYPRYYKVIFMTPVDELGWKCLPETNRARISSTFQFLVDRVKECQDAGIFRKGDPKELSLTVWAHVHGIVSLRLAGHLSDLTPEDFSLFYRRYADQLLEGLYA